jgi:hypothetical protein
LEVTIDGEQRVLAGAAMAESVSASCGKEPKDVERMLASRKAMICRGCLRELHAIATEDDAAGEG